MRRKDREITDFTKIIDVVDACDCCRIGLADHGEAYIVPMNFGYETENETLILYFHCARQGKKLDLIPLQKSVAFEMDTAHKLIMGNTACEFSYLYRCVMGKGKMEILTDQEQKIYGLKKIMTHYYDSADPEFVQKATELVCVLKLTVTSWSGKEHRH